MTEQAAASADPKDVADASQQGQQASAAAQTATGDAAAKPADGGSADGAAKPAGTMAEGAGTDAKAEPKWRDDWREALAGGDEKAMARLKRFQSPENVFKSWAELERKQSSGALRATMPDNPTDDDVAAYRKSWGVPDAVEGYEVKPPDGIDFSEPEQKSLNTFLAQMHANHVPKATVQKVAESYFAIRQQEEQELYEAAVETTTNYRVEIKTEYGRDYDRNVKLGNAELVRQLGPEKAKAISGLTLANGVKLGDHPDFVRFIVGSALANADDDMLVASEATSNGQSVQSAYDAAIALKFTDTTKYHSDEHQAKLKKLGDAVARSKSRAA